MASPYLDKNRSDRIISLSVGLYYFSIYTGCGSELAGQIDKKCMKITRCASDSFRKVLTYQLQHVAKSPVIENIR